jgi:hypothetical protein
MTAVTFIEKTNADGVTTEYAIIDRGNGEYTSMTKEHWDKLEAEREQSGTL